MKIRLKQLPKARMEFVPPMLAMLNDERIDVIAHDYYKAICEFHDWFFNRQKELHQQAFAEANALRQRLMNSKWYMKYPQP